MDFKEFKILFDESFGKVTPEEFIIKMESLGYVFTDIKPVQLSEDILVQYGFDVITDLGNDSINYWNKDADASVDVDFVITDNGIEVFFKYRCLGSAVFRKSIVYVNDLIDLHYVMKGVKLKPIKN